MDRKKKRLELLKIFANPRSIEVWAVPEGPNGEFFFHISRYAQSKNTRLHVERTDQKDLEQALAMLEEFFAHLIILGTRVLEKYDKLPPEGLSPEEKMVLTDREKGRPIAVYEGVTPEVVTWIVNEIKTNPGKVARTSLMNRKQPKFAPPPAAKT